MITIEQCRAARGLLNWTQQDLADASGLSKTAINNFEKGHSDIKMESLRSIKMAFESADLEFLEDQGLRRRKDTTQILKGPSALEALVDDICRSISTDSSEIFIANMDKEFARNLHPRKLLQLSEALAHFGASVNILASEVFENPFGVPCSIRFLPTGEAERNMTRLLYADKLALITGDYSMVILMSSSDACKSEVIWFENIWEQTAPTLASNESENIVRKGI